MIFKGRRYRKTRTVVSLPQKYWKGDIKNAITFGKICPADTHGAIKTTWTYKETREPVYALPIECKGHSLTCAMYSKTHLYLQHDGLIYMSPIKTGKVHG